MNKFKKGLSLLAVIAFLITALVPVSAFAAPNTPTVSPSSAQLIAGGQKTTATLEMTGGTASDTYTGGTVASSKSEVAAVAPANPNQLTWTADPSTDTTFTSRITITSGTEAGTANITGSGEVTGNSDATNNKIAMPSTCVAVTTIQLTADTDNATTGTAGQDSPALTAEWSDGSDTAVTTGTGYASAKAYKWEITAGGVTFKGDNQASKIIDGAGGLTLPAGSFTMPAAGTEVKLTCTALDNTAANSGAQLAQDATALSGAKTTEMTVTSQAAPSVAKLAVVGTGNLVLAKGQTLTTTGFTVTAQDAENETITGLSDGAPDVSFGGYTSNTAEAGNFSAGVSTVSEIVGATQMKPTGLTASYDPEATTRAAVTGISTQTVAVYDLKAQTTHLTATAPAAGVTPDPTVSLTAGTTFFWATDSAANNTAAPGFTNLAGTNVSYTWTVYKGAEGTDAAPDREVALAETTTTGLTNNTLTVKNPANGIYRVVVKVTKEQFDPAASADFTATATVNVTAAPRLLTWTSASEAKTPLAVGTDADGAAVAGTAVSGYGLEWSAPGAPTGTTAYTWKSSAEKVATAAATGGTELTGSITPKGPGQAKITATPTITGNNNPDSSDELTINVFQLRFGDGTQSPVGTVTAGTTTYTIPALQWYANGATGTAPALPTPTVDGTGTSLTNGSATLSGTTVTIPANAAADDKIVIKATATVQEQEVSAFYTINVINAADVTVEPDDTVQDTPTVNETPGATPEDNPNELIPVPSEDESETKYVATITDEGYQGTGEEGAASTPTTQLSVTTVNNVQPAWQADPPYTATSASGQEVSVGADMDAANAHKGTSVPLPNTAGVYTITTQVQIDANTTKTVVYEVTMEGTLDVAGVTQTNSDGDPVVNAPAGTSQPITVDWGSSGIGEPGEVQQAKYVWTITNSEGTPGTLAVPADDAAPAGVRTARATDTVETLGKTVDYTNNGGTDTIEVVCNEYRTGSETPISTPRTIVAQSQGVLSITGPHTLLVGAVAQTYTASWTAGEDDGITYDYEWVLGANPPTGTTAAGTDLTDGSVTPGTAAGSTTLTVNATDSTDGSATPAILGASAAYPIYVCEFGLASEAGTVITGAEGKIPVTYTWENPEAAAADLEGATYWYTAGSNPTEQPLTVANGGIVDGVLQLPIPAATTTYHVYAKLGDQTSDAVDYAVTVQSSVDDVTIENVSGTGDVDAGSVATDTDKPAFVDAAYIATVSETQYDGGQKALTVGTSAGSLPVGAQVKWSCTPRISGWQDSGTATIALPTTAGVYNLTARIWNPGADTEADPAAFTVQYTVVMQGVVQVSVPGNVANTGDATVREGRQVTLSAVWDNSAAVKQPVPAGQTGATVESPITYTWTVNGTAQSETTSTLTYTNTGSSDTVTVQAHVTQGTPSTAVRMGEQTVNLSDTGSRAINPAAPLASSNIWWSAQQPVAPATSSAISGKLPSVSGNDILWNSAATNTTMAIGTNKRFAIYVPQNYTGMTLAGNQYYQWEYRTSGNLAGGNGIILPTGQGFYGLNSNVLTSGPVTKDMEGWQFRLTKIDPDNVANNTYTPWLTLDVTEVTGTAGTTTPAVTVSSAPASATGVVTAAQTADVTLTATVTNDPGTWNLSYQWQSRPAPTAATPNPAWEDIDGATNPTYELPNVQASQSGVSYRCQVYNGSFLNVTGTSNSLLLQVNTERGAVIITAPTADQFQSLYASRTATFSVDAKTDNGDEVTYQWFRKGSPGYVTNATVTSPITTAAQAKTYLAQAGVTATAIPGATSATYTTPELEEGIYEYVCRVTNATNGTQVLNSNGFYLVVTQRSRIPNISEPAAATDVGTPAGTPVTFTCTATVQSGEPLTYQWYSSRDQATWSALHGETNATLTVPSPGGDWNGMAFRCTVTNATANTESISWPYYLTVWNTAEVPVPQSIEPRNTEGVWPTTTVDTLTSTATLPSSVTPNATNLTAQWLRNGKPLTDDDYAAYAGLVTVGTTTYDATKGTSTLTFAPTGSSLLVTAQDVMDFYNGTWTCRWTNASVTPTSAHIIRPYRDSGTCNVNYQVVGYPQIAVQPVVVTAAVGETATFSVGATIYQAPDTWSGTQIRPIPVYVWQRSKDGQNWENCESPADGTGQFTSTFTVPVTQTMYDNATAANVQGFTNPYRYRVNIGSSTTGYNVYSAEVALTITPGSVTPPTEASITVKDGVSLTISDNEELGKIVSGTGLTVSKEGNHASTVADMFSFVPEGAAYELRLVNASDEPLADDAIVGTGCQVQLIDTADDNAVLQAVTIIVRGDVNGSGVISLTQLVRMAAGFKDADELDALYTLAGDMDGSGAINLTDLVQEAAIYRAEILDAGAEPTSAPSAAPTAEPSAEPTAEPSTEPTTAPTTEPTSAPTAEPTTELSAAPTSTPSAA